MEQNKTVMNNYLETTRKINVLTLEKLSLDKNDPRIKQYKDRIDNLKGIQKILVKIMKGENEQGQS